MFQCPFPGCRTRTRTLYGLRNHYVAMHGMKYCPVCNREYRDLLKHLSEAAKKCWDHLILYGLLAKIYRGKGSNVEFTKMAREIAEEFLWVEE